jgi:hypothetical protein
MRIAMCEWVNNGVHWLRCFDSLAHAEYFAEGYRRRGLKVTCWEM